MRRTVRFLSSLLSDLAPPWERFSPRSAGREDLAFLGEPHWTSAEEPAPGWERVDCMRETPFKRTWRVRDPAGRACFLKEHFGRRPRRTFPDAREAAFVEVRSALELAHRGLRVATPLAVGGDEAGSWLLLEDLALPRTLEMDVQDGVDDVERRTPEVAALLARLHELGFVHRDFYACHLLHDGRGGPLHLIDLERVEPATARGRVKDAASYLHSTESALGRSGSLAFLARYARARGLSRKETRRFVRSALRKEHRIGTHRPKHDDPREDSA